MPVYNCFVIWGFVVLLNGNSHSFVAGARIRLVGGNTPYEGRLEARRNSQYFGTVCAAHFGYDSAAYVCRELGYGIADRNSYVAPSYPNSYRHIYSVFPTGCYPAATSFADCLLYYDCIHHPDKPCCRHRDDVAVRCNPVFDCEIRNPCRAPRFVSGKFKYPHEDLSLVVNCWDAEDGDLGCAVTSCQPGYIYNDTAQACNPRTYDCGHNGRNPCTPLAIEGKTVYAHDENTKKVQCIDGRCEVIPCPSDNYYNDKAQKCLPNRYDCGALNPCDSTTTSLQAGYLQVAVIACTGGHCFDYYCIKATGDLSRPECEGYRSMPRDYCYYGKYYLRGQCFDCPSGSFNKFKNQRECESCPFGYYQPGERSQGCIKCKVGTYADSFGLDYCMQCPKGTFQNRRGQRSCIPCSKGSYQDGIGQISCKRCTPGFYAHVVGRYFCPACWDGWVQSREGAHMCTVCPRGTYTDGWAQTSCQSCDDGLTTKLRASGSIDQCIVCLPGYAVHRVMDQRVCRECDVGTFSNKDDSESCAPCQAATQRGQSTCP